MVNSEAAVTRWRSEYAGPGGEVALTPFYSSFLATAEAIYESDNPPESIVLKTVNNLMGTAKTDKLPAQVLERVLVLGRLLISKFGRSTMDKEILTFFKSSPTPPRAGALQKTIASLQQGNVAHVVQGVMNKVESHPVLRPSLADIPKLAEANIAHLRSPYGIIKVKLTEEIAFSMAWIKAGLGGRVNWEYDLQGTIPAEVEKLYPHNNFIAFGSGTYVSDPKNLSTPVGFAVNEGKEINTYLDRNNHAIVVINGGQLSVYDYKETPWGDLTGTRSMTSFLHFYRDQHSSVFQSHLLIHKGKSQVGTNSNAEIQSRRILITLYDNDAALIYFDSPLTLYEAAHILKQIPGIGSAVNLDTGINNCGRMKLRDEILNQGCVSGGRGGGRLASPVVLTLSSAKTD